MKIVSGYYNELRYYVDLANEQGYEERLYTAGNSPFESQVQVDAEEGVGLEKMKQYCEQTTKEIAKERGLSYGGITYEEPDDSQLVANHTVTQ